MGKKGAYHENAKVTQKVAREAGLYVLKSIVVIEMILGAVVVVL
jgi:hypothetical protein